MTMASTVDEALKQLNVDFQILKHKRTETSLATAHSAHVSEDKLAKAVVLTDGQGYVVAVLAADKTLDVERLCGQLHRRLKLASEEEINELFYDCSRGAVPALGPWYQIPTLVDTALREKEDIYFESGDHAGLIHVSETSFEKLMRGAEFLELATR